MAKPVMSRDPLFQLLREEQVAEFNRRRAAGAKVDLRGTDLSRIDLRGLEADGLDLSDCYLRMSDLRGVDFRRALLEGASFASANISGCYFPAELAPDELALSIAQGTRVRYRRSP
jgi:uncharacterized protein YjbI with pentapeptide repeats